jgi:anti-anti-sigma regulatory factor
MSLRALPPPRPCAPSTPSPLRPPRVRAEGSRTVVIVRGGADLPHAPSRPVVFDVLARVVAVGTGDVVIDLAEVELLDTAAFFTMAAAERMLGSEGRKVTFRSPSRLAARVLSLFGLHDLIEAREYVSG